MKLSKTAVNFLMSGLLVVSGISAILGSKTPNQPSQTVAVATQAPVKTQAQKTRDFQLEMLEGDVKTLRAQYDRMSGENARNLVACEAVQGRPCAIDDEGVAAIVKAENELVTAMEALTAYKETGKLPNPCGKGVDCD